MVGKQEKDLRLERAHLEQDAEDLQGTPIVALKEAARRYRCGDIGDGKFRPTIGELIRKALEIAASEQRELSRLTKIVNARVDDRKTPDATRRRELVEQMRKGFFESRAETAAPDPEAEARAKRLNEIEARAPRRRDESVSLSDAARRAIGAGDLAHAQAESSAAPASGNECAEQ
jgi:type II secretory pathway component HofQ